MPKDCMQPGGKLLALSNLSHGAAHGLPNDFQGCHCMTTLKHSKEKQGGALATFGGPPCQRTSVSAAIHGKRDGESLWPEQLRITAELAAQWAILEQPTGNRAWESEVDKGFRGAGFHTARVEFAARDVGAPYLRRRVYVIACTSLSRLQVAWGSIPQEIDRVARATDARGTWDPRKLASLPVDARTADEFDGGPKSKERQRWIEALGDSNPPAMMEVVASAVRIGAS